MPQMWLDQKKKKKKREDGLLENLWRQRISAAKSDWTLKIYADQAGDLWRTLKWLKPVVECIGRNGENKYINGHNVWAWKKKSMLEDQADN